MKPPLKMNPNTTGVLYSVTFEGCAENFRRYWIKEVESRCNFLDVLDIDLYAAELQKIAQTLKTFCAERPEDRFSALRSLCVDGFAEKLFPDVYESVKEALGRGHEVGIMVHSAEGMMGIMDAQSFRIKH